MSKEKCYVTKDYLDEMLKGFVEKQDLDSRCPKKQHYVVVTKEVFCALRESKNFYGPLDGRQGWLSLKDDIIFFRTEDNT